MRELIIKDNDPNDNEIWIEIGGNVLIVTLEEAKEIMDSLYHIVINMEAQ